jgi:flagellar hook-associated protein 1 FlgK
VSGLTSLLNVMGQSLMAQQEGLDVTGQNVANVNTPGYVQRTAVLQAEAVMPGTEGGVDVAGVQRAFDQFTYAQVVQQTGLKGAADARSGALSEAQATLAPQGGGGISDQLTAFFASLSALSANPSDPSARSAVLAQASNLAQGISTTANGLAQQQASLLTQAQGVAGELNTELAQIAKLNASIQQAQAAGDQAPDLRDQRDQLVTQVADQIGAQVVADPSGSETILGGGAALVTGSQAVSVGVTVDTSGALKFTATGPNGGATNDITQGVTQGSLGGLREARDTDIAGTMSQLDQFAYNLANSVNAVHESGYGLDGNTGRPLFQVPTQVAGAAANFAVDPGMVGNPQFVAASGTSQDVPGGNDVAIKLAQLASSPLGSAGSPADGFASIAAQLGSAVSGANADATTRADTLTQAQNLNSSASGVSLDQEMTKLTQFQQAFQASTQVLQIANGLMTTLLNITTPA